MNLDLLRNMSTYKKIFVATSLVQPQTSLNNVTTQKHHVNKKDILDWSLYCNSVTSGTVIKFHKNLTNIQEGNRYDKWIQMDTICSSI
jgi:uncharacterized protein YegJ (DUF2314 family)